jgi:uncharacterized protein (DUF1697 family)
MKVFIALYRGINVLGKNSVKMEALRAMHERIGHRDVRSYIQSGNVIFAAKGSAHAIARKTAAEFTREFGFSPKVLILEAGQVHAIVKCNPYTSFAAKRPNTVHCGICQGAPDAGALTAFFTKAGATTEAFESAQEVVYLHAPDGYGKSKFAAGMERVCGVPMTVRNWRTIESLLKIAIDVAAHLKH